MVYIIYFRPHYIAEKGKSHYKYVHNIYHNQSLIQEHKGYKTRHNVSSL